MWMEIGAFVFLSVLSFLLVLNLFQRWGFQKDVDSVISSGFLGFSTEEGQKELPEPLERYCDNFWGDESRIAYAVLEHDGRFKTSNENSWKGIEGKEYLSGSIPSFVWKGSLGLLTVIDKFIGGKGSLKVSLVSSIRLSSRDGGKIDEAELGRWVAELPWIPSAFLYSPFVSWNSIDENSAEIKVSYRGVEFSGTYFFDEKGRPKGFEAERYHNGELRGWRGSYSDFFENEGFTVPGHVEVELGSGDELFRYAIFDVLSLDYELYE